MSHEDMMALQQHGVRQPEKYGVVIKVISISLMLQTSVVTRLTMLYAEIMILQQHVGILPGVVLVILILPTLRTSVGAEMLVVYEDTMAL